MLIVSRSSWCSSKVLEDNGSQPREWDDMCGMGVIIERMSEFDFFLKWEMRNEEVCLGCKFRV